MSIRSSRAGWLLAAVLAVALAVSLAPRLAGTFGETDPASAPRGGAGADPSPRTVTGPDTAATRAAIERATAWLAQTRIRMDDPAQLGRLRFYVMEVRCWYLLHAFAREDAERARYRDAVIERLQLLGDGAALVQFLSGAHMPNLITDLLILVVMAQDLGLRLPALDAALPKLYRLGDDPNRPVALSVALTYLAQEAGLAPRPTVAELRQQGMLAERPREATMRMPEVYHLTHEIFGYTEYGLAPGTFTPLEQAYLDRSLPFWALLHVILNLPDPAAEIGICQQVSGSAWTYGYGENIRYLVEIQSPAGTFGESTLTTAEPDATRLGYLHTLMVALHALLGHEALLTVGELPGRP